MIAFVRFVIFDSIWVTSMFHVKGSASTNIGTAPTLTNCIIHDIMVNAGRITSSPSLISRDSTAASIAAVPFVTAIACFRPILDAKSYYEKKINYPNFKQNNNTSGNHGIIFHEEDLSNYNVRKNDFILIQRSHFNPYNQNRTIEDFTNKSLKSFAEKFSNYNITYFDWNHLETIKTWKDKNNIESISTSYPCVGKLTKPITDAEKYLGIKFDYYMHEWDRLFWPHSNKGFFKLKKHIKKNIKILLDSK